MLYSRPVTKEQTAWLIIIAVFTTFIFGLMFFMDSPTGQAVFPHLLYIPIVIASWFFPLAGVLYTISVACGYMLFESGYHLSPVQLREELFHSLVFIITGVLVSFFSYRIRSHETRMETILTHIQSGVIRVSGPQAVITYSNPVAASLFHPMGEVLEGRSLYDLIVEHPLLRLFLSSCMDGKGNRCHEMRLRRSDQTTRWISLSGFHEDDESILITITDRTEQRTMEQDIIKGKIRQETLLDSIPEVIWLADSDGLLLAANRQCLEYTGKTEDTLIGMQIQELFSQDSVGQLNEGIREALTMQKIVRYDETIIRDGQFLQYEILIIPIYNPEGETISIAGVQRDVTQQQRLFSRIREQEEMLRTVLDGLPTASLVIDADHTVRYVNQALSMLLERDVSYLIGTKEHPLLFYDDLSHPLLCDLMLENEVDLALEEWHSGRYTPSPTVPGAFELFDRISTASAGDRWMKFTTVRLVNESGHIYGAIETCEDFSTLKETENAIRLSEERFKIASGIASDLIFEYTLIPGHLQWFGDLDRRLGYQQGEVEHTLSTWQSSIHEDDKERIASMFDLHIHTGEPVQDEMRIRQKNGAYLTWQVKAVAMYDADFRHYKSVGIITDVTLIRETEDAKRAALIAVEENIEQFAILGDHIRNPLQAIAGYNDLQGGVYGDKISMQVRIINEIIDRLDEGWIRSESIREFLRRHYGLERGPGKDRIQK